MSKTIRDYLPVKSKHRILLQARVPADIAIEVKKIMKKDRLSWADILTACLHQFLDEQKDSSKLKR